MAASKVKGIHLVGSIPLQSATDVFEQTSRLMGNHLKRIPDGETGERDHWISWQYPLFAATPQLEPVSADRLYGKSAERGTRLRLRAGAVDGVASEEIQFESLGYAAAAKASYQEFTRLKAGGVIPSACRFLVALPTPLSTVLLWVAPEAQAVVEKAYEAAILRELDEVLAALPHQELALQWDTCIEFGVLEGVFPNRFGDTAETELLTRLERLGNAIPDDVELGYHLCYGDAGHEHFTEPKDAGLLTQVANGIVSGMRRPLNWIHMPVPRNRADDAYFAPLKKLALPSETELYLGLVHMTDGLAGTEQRIEAAKRHVQQFGVATECGLGRRPAETIPALMKIHTAVAQPHQ